MNTVMSAKNLILCLSGELLVDPALLLEIVKGEEEALRVIRSYGAGDLTYSQVMDTIRELV